MEGDVSCLEPVEFTVKDTFHIEPGVEGNGDLAARVKKLGMKLEDSLREGVTVCVVGRAHSVGTSAGMGGVAGQLRGRRRDRIHRMMAQAQSEPLSTARPGSQGTIVGRANALDSKVVPESTFRRWLAGLEFRGRRTASRDRGLARSAEVRQGTPQPPIPQLRRYSTGAERRRVQEHPRMVIKDLDGLEPDRIQAFPPELLRKCNLHEDAPPGISPFTPREQWEREKLKLKNRGTKSAGTGKFESRVPNASTTRVRRGGWCECCERAYVGTMSEHCASSKHKASVAEDPDFASLLALVGWGNGKSEPPGMKTFEEVGTLLPTPPPKTAEVDEAAGKSREMSRPAGDGNETPSLEAGDLRSGDGLQGQVALAERADGGACPVASIATSPGNIELPPIRGIAEGTSDGCGKENLPTALILPEAGVVASGGGYGGRGAEGVTSPCRPQPQLQQTWAHCDGKGGDGYPSPLTPRAHQKPLSPRRILVTPSTNGAGCNGSEAVGGNGMGTEDIQRVVTAAAAPDKMMHPTADGAEPEAERTRPDTKQSVVPGCSSENSEAASGCGAQLDVPHRSEQVDEGEAITQKVAFKAQPTQSRLPIVGKTPECYRHASGGGELTETPSIRAAQQAKREIVATVTPEDSQWPTEVDRAASMAASGVVHSDGSPARRCSGDPAAACPREPAPREKEAPRKKKSRRELDMLADSTGFAEASARSTASSRPRRGGPRQSPEGAGRQGTAGSRRRTSPGLWSLSCGRVSGGGEDVEEATSSSGSGSSRRSMRIPREERSSTERDDEEGSGDRLADTTVPDAMNNGYVSDATSSGAIRRKRRRQGSANNASRKISPMKGNTRSGTLDLESNVGSGRTLERVTLTPSRKRGTPTPLKQDSGGRSPPDVTFDGTAVWQCLAEAGAGIATAIVDSGASGSDGHEGCKPANDAGTSVPVMRVVQGEADCLS